ncbi:MAG TPA: DUF1049 domain-containing protein [Cyanothece sp. UBA12306]|nr:DUF1049 domain-containing protein [Cyanothece sp. UBA12306]
MKTITNLITSLIIAFWLGAIAIFSIQNITEISLKFLVWQSIKLPVGVLLAFSIGGGLILGVLLIPLLTGSKSSKRKRSLRDFQTVDEFDF